MERSTFYNNLLLLLIGTIHSKELMEIIWFVVKI